MQWLSSTIAPLQNLIGFLYKKSKTNDVHKKQLLTELRDNLNVFKNAFMDNTPYENVIDLLSNSAIRNAVKENFNFNKLRQGKIAASHIKEDRNKRYLGWTTEKLTDKIDEKIQELKNIKQLNGGNIKKIEQKVSIKLSNLYFRMKLLADFIQSGS
ncbi:MAG: hypothetical protein HYR66_06130 [Sphingobacteriales bacterium]|nr:hypothetical protein [Sphingobacteriales bacterium]MBI3717233.1 hypothetical protein [Sphingobacteriales bacterium]